MEASTTSLKVSPEKSEGRGEALSKRGRGKEKRAIKKQKGRKKEGKRRKKRKKGKRDSDREAEDEDSEDYSDDSSGSESSADGDSDVGSGDECGGGLSLPLEIDSSLEDQAGFSIKEFTVENFSVIVVGCFISLVGISAETVNAYTSALIAAELADVLQCCWKLYRNRESKWRLWKLTESILLLVIICVASPFIILGARYVEEGRESAIEMQAKLATYVTLLFSTTNGVGHALKPILKGEKFEDPSKKKKLVLLLGFLLFGLVLPLEVQTGRFRGSPLGKTSLYALAYYQVTSREYWKEGAHDVLLDRQDASEEVRFNMTTNETCWTPKDPRKWDLAVQTSYYREPEDHLSHCKCEKLKVIAGKDVMETQYALEYSGPMREEDETYLLVRDLMITGPTVTEVNFTVASDLLFCPKNSSGFKNWGTIPLTLSPEQETVSCDCELVVDRQLYYALSNISTFFSFSAVCSAFFTGPLMGAGLTKEDFRLSSSLSLAILPLFISQTAIQTPNLSSAIFMLVRDRTTCDAEKSLFMKQTFMPRAALEASRPGRIREWSVRRRTVN
jgi:hypothetical protein